MITTRQLVHAGQMTLFGPSPAERERQRLYVLEGRHGLEAREALVRRDRGRFVQPEPDTPVEVWRPAPAAPTPLPQRRMFFARPAKPLGEMTDAEIEDFATQFMRGVAEQVAQAKHTHETSD